MQNNHWPANERYLHFAQRRGMTLVEVSVAVAISALLLGVAVSLLVRLQRWDVRFRDDATTTRQVAQLAELIRKDVRSATNVALASPKAIIINMHDERDIRYELTPSGCLRIVERPLGKEVQRELFRVGPELIWNADTSSSGVHPNLTVTLELRGPDPDGRNKVLLLVSANRGADLRAGMLLSSTQTSNFDD